MAKDKVPRGIRQLVLKRLATIATGAALCALDPAPSLAEIPGDLVSDVVEEAASPEWGQVEKTSLLKLLVQDGRASVRSSVGEVVDALCPEDASEEILRTLAVDPSLQVRLGAARALARVLARAKPMLRLEISVEWALAVDSRHRLALARALHSAPRALATDWILAHLGRDEEALVRAAALGAATHLPGAPSDALIATMLHDEDARVRARARKAYRERLA